MSVNEVNFWYWIANHVLPKKAVYFCAMSVIVEASTGKYSNRHPEEIKAMSAVKEFSEKHGIGG